MPTLSLRKNRSDKGGATAVSNQEGWASPLQARWKGGNASGPVTPEPIRSGQIRSFRIAKLDPSAKKFDLELA